MLLFYGDNTMQVVVHTANMIEIDWRNKTQGVFKTGRLKKKINLSPLPSCSFQRDLIEYLQHYKDHQEFTNKIVNHDFTSVRGVLIASVPGKFSGPDKNKWGHLKLRSVLRRQVEIQKEFLFNSKIICQISSVGSLGKDSQDWLRGEFEASLSSYRNSSYMASTGTSLCIVYPTAENVRTSANLSKPAWGEMKASEFSIQSYELGVLVFPGLFEDLKESGEDLHVYMMNATLNDPYPEPRPFAQEDTGAESNKTTKIEDADLHHGIGVVTVRLPYDLPLRRYDHTKDSVWLSGKYFPGVDDFGRTLER
ncbi:tyrosyl-DNA phosphodiesterase 1 [Entomortierella beljakovae]|nr:tyrosyl-DNA phosphodiesterase 1 [Entomortierella beljakovae]